MLSNDFWTEEHWAALGFSSAEDFRIGFLEGYFGPMDAADLVCQAWKWRHGDVSRHTGGDLAAEQALVPGSELRVIEDVHGHASLFGLGADYAKQVDGALSDLLSTSV